MRVPFGRVSLLSESAGKYHPSVGRDVAQHQSGVASSGRSTNSRFIRALAIECSSELIEALDPPVPSVGKLVLPIPSPRCDHRTHQDAAKAKKVLVRAWVVLCHFFGGVGDVELDRPTAACLEVYKQRPLPGVQQVARMRLTVQQLIAAPAGADRCPQATQRPAEEFPVGLQKVRALLSIGNHPLCLGDSVGEMGCPQIDLVHAGMEPGECARIVGRRHV